MMLTGESNLGMFIKPFIVRSTTWLVKSGRVIDPMAWLIVDEEHSLGVSFQIQARFQHQISCSKSPSTNWKIIMLFCIATAIGMFYSSAMIGVSYQFSSIDML
ncbi:hypothetical protein Ddye_028834 [Dipteronia dyeriana]|uniref:Uncharacterized protein n=1 Tax=Dipteronia dyeriana TaxID=168575 RepID=A0AAD9TDH3_9ROSI|nr:hypothetical protein Ddye_028834 [Dipteronia dyeriana]